MSFTKGSHLINVLLRLPIPFYIGPTSFHSIFFIVALSSFYMPIYQMIFCPFLQLMPSQLLPTYFMLYFLGWPYIIAFSSPPPQFFALVSSIKPPHSDYIAF